MSVAEASRRPREAAAPRRPHNPVSGRLLQRRCGCGGVPGPDGECTSCRAKRLQGIASPAGPVIRSRTQHVTALHSLEAEADRVADERSVGPAARRASKAPLFVQPVSHHVLDGTGAPPPSVGRVLARPGLPLEPALKRDMELRFGHDFSRVRLHTDAAAARSADDLDARAFTAGRHIVFGSREFAPETTTGRHLLAHELTHVVQQSAADTSPPAGDHVARAPIMRKGFESTVKVCHRVLESRTFDVRNGGVRVVMIVDSPDSGIRGCRDFDFGVTLTRSEDWWPDDEIASCEAPTGGTRSFAFARIPSGT